MNSTLTDSIFQTWLTWLTCKLYSEEWSIIKIYGIYVVLNACSIKCKPVNPVNLSGGYIILICQSRWKW